MKILHLDFDVWIQYNRKVFTSGTDKRGKNRGRFDFGVRLPEEVGLHRELAVPHRVGVREALPQVLEVRVVRVDHLGSKSHAGT